MLESCCLNVLPFNLWVNSFCSTNTGNKYNLFKVATFDPGNKFSAILTLMTLKSNKPVQGNYQMKKKKIPWFNKQLIADIKANRALVSRDYFFQIAINFWDTMYNWNTGLPSSVLWLQLTKIIIYHAISRPKNLVLPLEFCQKIRAPGPWKNSLALIRDHESLSLLYSALPPRTIYASCTNILACALKLLAICYILSQSEKCVSRQTLFWGTRLKYIHSKKKKKISLHTE